MVPTASPYNLNQCLLSIPCSRFPCSCLSYLNQSCEHNYLIQFQYASMKWVKYVNCIVMKAEEGVTKKYSRNPNLSSVKCIGICFLVFCIFFLMYDPALLFLLSCRPGSRLQENEDLLAEWPDV